MRKPGRLFLVCAFAGALLLGAIALAVMCAGGAWFNHYLND